MAKLSTVLRDKKRRKLVAKFKAKRTALAAVMNDFKASDDDRAAGRRAAEAK